FLHREAVAVLPISIWSVGNNRFIRDDPCRHQPRHSNANDDSSWAPRALMMGA
ncbi:unnamed protein product, partial [Ectocarpus fasciculatus]